MFFKSKPNVSVAEKARLEFYLQQIAEAIGFERLMLPILSMSSLLESREFSQSPDQIIESVGKHLSHDVSSVQYVVVPQAIEKSGGGG